MKNKLFLLVAAATLFGCKAVLDTEKNTSSINSELNGNNCGQTYIVKTISEEQGFNRKSLENAGAKIQSSMDINGYTYWLVYGSEINLKNKLEAVTGVAYAELNTEIKAPEYEKMQHSVDFLPLSIDTEGDIKNDPAGYKGEYALRITKARNFYENGVLKEGAFKSEGYGTNEVIAGIIDTGINMNHIDFKNSGNSIVLYAKSAFSEQIVGNDFQQLQGSFRTLNVPSNEDAGGHGTHCSGSICAVGDNNKGICGVAWKNTKLISYKGLGLKSGSGWSIYGSLADFAEITKILKKQPSDRTNEEKNRIPVSVPADYVITQKTIPVNMSLGGGQLSNYEMEMINYAIENDILPVAAMGNEGRTIPAYPASIQGVLAVGATTAQDKKAAFSTSGSWISVCAPGHNIISSYNGKWSGNTVTNDTGGEVNFNGTSMATPFVTGLISYLLSFNEARNLTPYQIKRILEQTADKIDSDNPHFGYNQNGFSKYYGYGRVNVLEAVRCIKGKGKPIPQKNSFYSEYTVKINVSENSFDKANAKIFVYEDSTNICNSVLLTNRNGIAELRGLKIGKSYTAKVSIDSSNIIKEIKFDTPETADKKISVDFN